MGTRGVVESSQDIWNGSGAVRLQAAGDMRSAPASADSSAARKSCGHLREGGRAAGSRQLLRAGRQSFQMPSCAIEEAVPGIRVKTITIIPPVVIVITIIFVVNHVIVIILVSLAYWNTSCIIAMMLNIVQNAYAIILLLITACTSITTYTCFR